ncbi:MAG: lipid A phosphate methyltransferase [Micavibrio aeruginosavorus]|uniref:Lipid A phosphate methyltransferase n=1 Tax=Micavibrio aeruginosavorus TaxID=349221 RepID=A0A2W5FMT0_9BACT|nr:MAG: lipid A phosphate methyltransferase [Micavibrio aeruginosavorus]
MLKQGNFLFRWRGQLPLFFLVPMIFAIYGNFPMEQAISEYWEDVWGILAFLISLIGLCIRGTTVGFAAGNTSGRNTREQRADDLNTSGMYSVCRNPLYLGNFIIILGVLLWAKVWCLGLIIALAFFIYMERIVLVEESYLYSKFQSSYDEWRKQTPALIPDFSLWKNPTLSFSWKTVLRKEYPGLLGVSTIFIIMHFVFDVIADRETINEWLSHDYPAIVAYVIIASLCLILRFLKKNTSVLKI